MKRRSREEWQQLIQQQQESGLKASEFCKQHGLCEKYFSTVKYKLKKQSPEQSPFQSIGIVTSSANIELRLGALTMSIPSGVDAKWLAELATKLTA